jgi:hypothetical protein
MRAAFLVICLVGAAVSEIAAADLFDIGPFARRHLYNNFVSRYYPDVNVFTEEYRQWRYPSGPFYKSSDDMRFLYRFREVLIREEGDTLWLAGGVPQRWLSPNQKIEIRGAATYFGPTSYRMEARESEITAPVQLPACNPCREAWLVLRAPRGKMIRSVEIDGRCGRTLPRLPNEFVCL